MSASIRCRIRPLLTEPVVEAEFLGLLIDENEDTVCVVRRIDGSLGLFVTTVHPSRVTFLPQEKQPREEA